MTIEDGYVTPASFGAAMQRLKIFMIEVITN